MKELTIEQARQRSMIGLATEGFKIVKRSLEDRLIDALRQNTAFVTHWQYQILVNMESEKSAVVYSEKDRNRYQVTFELDAFGEPRITRIEPIGRLEDNEEVIREQVHQRMIADLPIDEKQLDELKALNERDEKEASRKLQLEQLTHRRLAGLLTDQQYVEKRDRLLIEQHAERTGKKPLLEGDSKAKREALWAQYRAGELSLDETVDACARIRLAEESGRSSKPRLLTEKCGADCECEGCETAYRQVQLEESFKAGDMSKFKYELCLEALTCRDPKRKKEIEDTVFCYG